MGHKTRHFILKPYFLVDYCTFLYKWKQERMLYRGVMKFTTAVSLCLNITW